VIVVELNETITKIMKLNHGTLKASDAKLAGIDYKKLRRLADADLLERVSHGLYIDASYLADDYFVAQHRCGKGVFSHETALFFHDLSDRVPFQLMITIPSGYNTRLLKDKKNYRFFYCKPELHQVGVTTALSPHGNTLRVYDRERTLCDCVKKQGTLDLDLVLTAIKSYMREKDADLAKLLDYAETFKIKEAVKQYTEILV
jgi:predicted transcriptional regulator of viral defense system